MMKAVGGATSALMGARLLFVRNALPNDGPAAAGTTDGVPTVRGSAVFISAAVDGIAESAGAASAAGAGGASGRAATRAVALGEAGAEFAAAESERGVDAEAGARRPSSARAKTDGPKNTNSMAAMATLIGLPQT